VHPADSALEWGEGRVPAPGSTIAPSWRKQGEKLAYRLDAFAGNTITVNTSSTGEQVLER
jgi:hypothetical protein